MRGGLHIGRIFGIQIILDFSAGSATDAIGQLADGKMSQIPVLHAGRFVGMLHLRDVRGWLSLQVKESRR